MNIYRFSPEDLKNNWSDECYDDHHDGYCFAKPVEDLVDEQLEFDNLDE